MVDPRRRNVREHNMDMMTDDLVINKLKGIAYQVDRSHPVPYDNAYFDKTAAKTLKEPINKARKEIVDKFCPNGMILDVGVGDGAFLEHMGCGYGYDIMEKSVQWLKDRNMYIDIYKDGIPMDASCVTLFDVLEHLPEPYDLLRLITTQYLIVAIPIIEDILKVRTWKHYRPNEHFWNFEHNGFIDYMIKKGFGCLEVSDAETKAGREDILTFVFRRV